MNKWLRALLLLLQIGGGILGFVIIGRVLWETDQSQVTVTYNTVFLAVFAFGILAGVALITRPGLGLVLSLIFQGIQIPIFASPPVLYNMYSGGFFNVYWHENGWGTNFVFLWSRCVVDFNSSEPLFLSVNILALAMFVLLIREMWWRVAELRSRMFKFADTPTEPVMDQDPPSTEEPSAPGPAAWRGA